MLSVSQSYLSLFFTVKVLLKLSPEVCYWSALTAAPWICVVNVLPPHHRSHPLERAFLSGLKIVLLGEGERGWS